MMRFNKNVDTPHGSSATNIKTKTVDIWVEYRIIPGANRKSTRLVGTGTSPQTTTQGQHLQYMFACGDNALEIIHIFSHPFYHLTKSEVISVEQSCRKSSNEPFLKKAAGSITGGIYVYYMYEIHFLLQIKILFHNALLTDLFKIELKTGNHMSAGNTASFPCIKNKVWLSRRIHFL